MICTYTNHYIIVHKDIFACLFSIHNTISLCHEQVCISGLVHDMINLLYYASEIFNDKKSL